MLESNLEKRIEDKVLDKTMTSVVYQDKLYLFYCKIKSGEICYKISSGGEWDDGGTIKDIKSAGCFSATVLGNKLYLFYRAKSSSNILYSCLNEDSWEHEKKANVRVKDVLRVVVFRGVLYLFYNDSKRNYIRYKILQGEVFGSECTIREKNYMHHRFSVSVFNDRIYVFYNDKKKHKLIFQTYFNGENWSSRKEIEGKMYTALDSCVYNGNLYVLHDGYDKKGSMWEIIVCRSHYFSEKDSEQRIVIGKTSGIMTSCSFNGSLWLMYSGRKNKNYIYYQLLVNLACTANAYYIRKTFLKFLKVDQMYVGLKPRDGGEEVFYSCHGKTSGGKKLKLKKEKIELITDANILSEKCEINLIKFLGIDVFSMETGDAGIIYGLNGLSFQMANRILVATGSNYVESQRVKNTIGYFISCLLYGEYGENVLIFSSIKFLNKFCKKVRDCWVDKLKRVGLDPSEYMDMSDGVGVSDERVSVLVKSILGSNYDEKKILQILEKKKIMLNNLRGDYSSVKKFVDKVNFEVNNFMKECFSFMNVSDYVKLFGVKPNEEMEFLDLEEAKKSLTKILKVINESKKE